MAEGTFKNLYLVLSETGSLPSRFIHFFTKDGYSHVSLSVDRNLPEMYTFGRKYLYSIFQGGYIKECIHERMYKRFKNTRMAVIEISVDDVIYTEIKRKLHAMYEDKKKFHYNYRGIVLAYFKKNKKRKNYYYCSEFVYEILYEFGIINNRMPNRVVRPNDFLGFGLGKLIYIGFMRAYKCVNN